MPDILKKILLIHLICISFLYNASAQKRPNKIQPSTFSDTLVAYNINTSDSYRNIVSAKDSLDIPANDSLHLKNENTGSGNDISLTRLGIVCGTSRAG